MATGRILQFDEMRAFGFIAADDNGEDVFLHSSVFDGDPSELAPGKRVEFQVMEGGRGRKAFEAHLLEEGEDPVTQPKQEMRAASQSSTVEEGMCDVLSQVEFSHEITELLLEAAPSLTGGQFVQVRQGMLEFAKKHSWVDA